MPISFSESYKVIKSQRQSLGTVSHAWIPNTQEAEAGELL